ncbi:hypothetical protein [Bradyrhizobium sp. 169]|uniref:hypothetical protein n=1 Tax=Bradyrhizobium sp. 169 TaxID=2782640 RepID=UPI001FF79A06|nr:hypothetical protein [Bradyrhizobium sp. 169]MCK1590600.1 hypothetical protein [Bradyrhizobium sp. 169]
MKCNSGSPSLVPAQLDAFVKVMSTSGSGEGNRTERNGLDENRPEVDRAEVQNQAAQEVSCSSSIQVRASKSGGRAVAASATAVARGSNSTRMCQRRSFGTEADQLVAAYDYLCSLIFKGK